MFIVIISLSWHIVSYFENLTDALCRSAFRLPAWLPIPSKIDSEHIFCGAEPLLGFWTTTETCHSSHNVGVTGPVEMVGKMFCSTGKMFCSAVQCCCFCGEHRLANDVQKHTLFVPLHQTTQQHTQINLVPSLLSVWDWLHGLWPQHYGSYEGS